MPGLLLPVRVCGDARAARPLPHHPLTVCEVEVYLTSDLSPQTRLRSCYLDFNHLIVHAPSSLTVESSFFLNAHVELRAAAEGAEQAEGDGGASLDNVIIRDNLFAAKSTGGYASVKLSGSFVGGRRTIIDDSASSVQDAAWPALQPPRLKATRASRTLHLVGARRWAFDFADELLLPEIDRLSYTLVTDDESTFVRHVARRPIGTTAIVETDANVSATVTISVVQADGGSMWPRRAPPAQQHRPERDGRART